MEIGWVGRRVEVLLVEDNPGDVRLAREALEGIGVYLGLNVVKDGVEALAFLRREGEYAAVPRPHLVLLDLNLPRKSGWEVLAEVKADKDLRRIPVIVFTISQADEDVLGTYNLHANCYICKPGDFDRFAEVMRSVGVFWTRIAKLPT